MAGQPMARAEEGVLDAMGIDTVCELRGNGLTVRELTEQAGCSTATFWRWLRRGPPGERLKRWQEANEALAEHLVEKSREIVDNVAEARDAIAKAKAQSDAYRWEAARRNRAAWGDQPIAAVQVNLGDLHLQALRRPTGEIVVGEAQAPALPPGDPDLDDLYGADGEG